jgi:hypothetical protein
MATGGSGTKTGRRLDQLGPAIYLLGALALAALLLPSALRPPLQQPDQSGAFSPNAPQNRNQTIYEGAHNATSGAFAGVAAVSATGASTTTTTPPSVPKPEASACPYGVGNPPRQIPSVYGPPCAAAFTGNNGGATAYGVTANTINICFLMSLTGASGTDGEQPQTVQPGEGAVPTTYTVLEQYFNSHYQFYGRQLRFYYVSAGNSESTTAEAQARADKAKNTDHCFASIQETNPDELDELARDGVLSYTLAQLPESYFGSKDPYLWSFTPSATNAIRMGAEYYCKKLAGRPPTYTNDKAFNYQAPRKVGLIVLDTAQYGNMAGLADSLLARCGVKPAATVQYDLASSASGSSGLASDMVALRAAGVTTVFYLGDLLSAGIFTEAAYSNSYFPEWYLPGFGGVDTGHIGRDYNGYEWAHAFGYSFYEVPEPDEDTECYQAFHAVDPNTDPDSGMCTYMWGDMVQLFGGFQEAGPHLTAASFKKALLAQPSLGPNPPWHMAGGYSETNHTFPLYAAEIWWDPNAIGSDGAPGTYRYLNDGQRYSFGQWPSGPSPGLFKTGISLQPGT